MTLNELTETYDAGVKYFPRKGWFWFVELDGYRLTSTQLFDEVEKAASELKEHLAKYELE